MEFLLNRYRNLTVLLVVIVAQLLLIAYQVKTNKDIPLIRVWAVTTVTPIERTLEFVRRNTWGFVEDYFVLIGTHKENSRLKEELGRLKLENQYLRTELSTADRARALSVFQSHSPSKTVAARVIGNGTGANSKVVFIDRGSAAGVESGMAIVTPDGIVGKVVAAYPTASLVLMITDANFSAGVISQKNRVRGTLKGQGHPGTVLIDYVQNEERVDTGEWFYTSGDDRIFPKGFPVGQVSTARNGRTTKEVYLAPSGFQNGLEEVLIVMEGVHQDIPETEIATPGYKLLPLPPEQGMQAVKSPAPSSLNTDADRLHDQYRKVGDEQKHVFGVGLPGSKPPDFSKLPGVRQQPPPAPAAARVSPDASANTGAPKTLPPQTIAPPPIQAQAGKTTQPAPKTPIPGTNLAKPKPTTVTQTDPEPPPVKVKPKISGPLLVTDPTDADPTMDTPPVQSPRPKLPPATTKPAPVKSPTGTPQL